MQCFTEYECTHLMNFLVGQIDRWKAAEFRLFLLYTGPVAIRKFVSDAVYKHFMLLSVA